MFHLNRLNLLFLAGGLVLTVAAAWLASAQLDREARFRFERQASDARQALAVRVSADGELLHGLQGFFAGSSEVNRDEFARYVARLELEQRHRGVLAVGFIRRVPADAVAAFEAGVRTDPALPPAERAAFRIRGEPGPDDRLVIDYIEPQAPNLAVFGIDIGAEPTRRAALDLARDSGKLSATPPLRLLQETGQQQGFLLLAPIYRNGAPSDTVTARRKALLGFAYAAIRSGELLAGAFTPEQRATLAVAIDDVDAASTPPRRQPFGRIGDAIDGPTIDLPLAIGGRTWILSFTNLEVGGAHAVALPLLVLLGGFAITAIVLGVLRSLVSARTQAAHLAERMTQRLRASEHRARSIVDNALDAIIVIDRDGRVESFSRAGERIFGYPADEVIGRNVNMLMPEPYASNHDDYLHAYLTTGRRKIIGIGRAVAGRRKDGSTFPMDLAVSEMGGDGERRFVGIVRDITDRKAAEQALLKTNILQQAILDAANFSIISTDPTGVIRTFNHGAESLLGYRADELVGHQTLTILHDEDEVTARAQALSNELGARVPPGFETFVAKARRGDADENEWTYRCKNGDRVPVLLSVTALRTPSGTVTGFLAIASDQRERQRIERMKREFVSVVSHELRTPLTSIRGSLGLVEGGIAGALPEKARDLVAMAVRNCDRLVRLINDILDMEKVESGKMIFDLHEQPLLPLLDSAIEATQAFARQHQTHIETADVAPAAARVAVRVDADRLTQVLTNLLSNAVKYSPPEVPVTLSVSLKDERVRVTVRDQGPGIPEEFQSRIFQKFSQADSSATRQKGGTGLGLAICKAMIEHMHGRIGFDTGAGAGAGTRFWFDLPVAGGLAAVIPAPADLAEGPRILVCEDDPDVAQVIAFTLTQAGYQVDTAKNATTAKALIGDRSYAALTVDIGLPDQDGLSLIHELRETGRIAGVPVVVVSGRARTDGPQLGGTLSIVDWLDKPFDRKRLVTAVAHAVGAPDRRPVILHVEDDADLCTMVATLLVDQADLVAAGSLAAARTAWSGRSFDLVILDVALPDGSGFDLLPLIESSPRPVPVLIFSALERTADWSDAVADVLVKSRTSNDRLLAVIQSLIRRSSSSS